MNDFKKFLSASEGTDSLSEAKVPVYEKWEGERKIVIRKFRNALSKPSLRLINVKPRRKAVNQFKLSPSLDIGNRKFLA